MAINLYSKTSVDSLLSAKLSISSLTNAAATTLNATAPTTDQVLSFDGTELKWATVSGGGGAAWGGITGTLSSQTDLQNALDLKAPLASPTFTGTVTIPAGASISGYLTTASASSTYLAKASNLSDLANAATARTNLGLGGLAVLNDAPSNGSQYARQNGAWAVVTGGGGGSGGVDIQTFGSPTTSGTFTWTKPANAKVVEIYMWGAGGGGSAGSRWPQTTARGGGGGGSAGTFFYGKISANFLGATEAVVVGAGNAGGLANTTDGNGNAPASAPTGSTFSIFQAPSGQNGSWAGGAGGRISLYGTYVVSVGASGQGNPSIGNAANGVNYYNLYSTGGGGGGGAAASSTVAAGGGAGGNLTAQVVGAGIRTTVAGGSGGTTAGVAATAGSSATTEVFRAGTGGGGGYFINNAAGGAGGAGGWPAGGGGGGGAATTGFNSGAGGAGANGYVVIITYT